MNGQAARAVIGQYTFTYGGAVPGLYPTTPGQQILGGLSGLGWANGTLLVADSNRVGAAPPDHRVVLFNTNLIPGPNADLTNAPAYSTYNCKLCGFPASNQLGQPSFTPPAYTSACPSTDLNSTPCFLPGVNNTASTSNMTNPTAVASDGNIVAVADTDNNRVLIWNSFPTSLNQPASVVLGQTNFTTVAPVSPGGVTASSMRGPQGVWIQNGKLFVADTQNYRVLIWNSIPTANNQPADLVLGQSNFTSGTQAACDPTKSNYTSSANELCNPVSVTSDGVHLFVSDLGFNRVLIWNSIPNSNAQNADVVVGQPNMQSAVPNNPAVCHNGTGPQGQCEATLNFPRFALSDGVRLFVADGGNDRVLIYDAVPASNGVAADRVLGQPSMTTDVVTLNQLNFASTTIDNTSGVDVTPGPTSLAYDGQNLYVSDPIDNRVLVFTPGNTMLPNNSVLNWASEIVRQEGIVSISLAAGTGAIVANDTATVTISGKAYNYTVVKTDTVDTIAQGLVGAINSGSGDPNATAIFAGTGTGSLYLSSRGINLPNDSISLAASTSNTADIVASVSGNGNLSSGNAATAAPGMLVEINGSNLSDLPPSNPATSALSGVIPRTLGGAQVYMDGIAAPLFSVSSTQIVSQVPFEFTDRNSTSIYVRTQHSDGSITVTNATPVYIAPANPGLFDTRGSGSPPYPAKNAFHQPGNPEAVVDLTGTVNSGDVLTISINNVAYSYTVQSSDSLNSITSNLAAAINKKPDPLVTASVGAAFNRVVVTAKQSGSAGSGIPVSTTVSSGAKITLTAYTSATCCAVVPNSPIVAGNPAAPGEVITLSAAGLGQVNNQSNTAFSYTITGQPYAGPTDNNAVNSVSATMGSTTAQVVSAFLPQGSYGTYQVQMIVPSGQASNNNTQVYIAQNAYVSNIVTLPVGPANSNPNPPPVGNSPITINFDLPASGAKVSGSTNVAGWIVDKNTTISSAQVSVDNLAVGSATYGAYRPDVCAAKGNLPGCPNVGFNYMLDTARFADGSHNIQLTATDANGARLTIARSIVTSNYSNPTTIQAAIDQPGAQSSPFQGLAQFGGWALDLNAPVSTVTVLIDDVTRGAVDYGVVSRPDVCALYPSSPNCPAVGWTYLFDTTSLANGTHTFAIDVQATNGDHAFYSNSLVVANWTTADPIIVTIDTPGTQSGPFSGSRIFGGWAVSQNSKIASINVAVDDVPMGAAGYGGKRSDVCSAIGNYPGCPNVGWSFLMDTTLLADGVHTLRVTANPFSGQGSISTVQFTVANQGTASNPTLVNIDTPSKQNSAFSGFAALGGWAINDNAPVSTVQVSVDGYPNGYATYGASRPDVCAHHPGRPGCPNVGWNYLLDTTLLTSGSHTVEVTATTSNGHRATASAAFTVSNAVAGPTSVTISQPTSQSNAFQGLAAFSGAAVSSTAALTSISVSIDGYPYGSATYTAGAIGSPVNWSFLLNTDQLVDGTHTIGVAVTAADGTSAVQSATFQVANWSSPDPVQIDIDQPNSSSSAFSGQAAFGGWVLDRNSPIASVSVAIDGLPYGSASYGFPRPDVCKVYPGQPGCPNVGWNFAFDSTLLANGTHTLAVTATTPSGQSSTKTATFVIAN